MARRSREQQRDGTPAVVVHGQGVRVDHRDTDVPRAEVRSRFGGVDVPAVLSGAMAALGATALLSALLASLGRVGYTSGGVEGSSLGVAGLAAGLVTLALALLLGGWVAGRMARYDGGRNGLLSGVAFVGVTAIIGTLAATTTSAGGGVTLPTWASGELGVGTVLATLAALAVVLVTAYLGGRFGERWHRQVDDVLVHTHAGGIGTDRRGAAS